MQNENGKNLLPRGPKMLPGKGSGGAVKLPAPAGGKGRPTPAGRIAKLPAPAGGKNVDSGFGQGRRPAPGGAVKLPAPAGGKGMPGKTQGVVNRDAAKKAAIKRIMGPRGY